MGTRYRANPISDFTEVAFTVTVAHGPDCDPRPVRANDRELEAIHQLTRHASVSIGDVVRGKSDGGDSYDPEHVSVIVGTVDRERSADVLQVAHDVAEVLDEECLYVAVGGESYLVGPGA